MEIVTWARLSIESSCQILNALTTAITANQAPLYPLAANLIPYSVVKNRQWRSHDTSPLRANGTGLDTSKLSAHIALTRSQVVDNRRTAERLLQWQ